MTDLEDEIEESLDDLEPTPDSVELYEHFRVVADKGQSLLRVDKFLFDHLEHSSRNRIQNAADAGMVMANGRPVKSNYKVKPLDVITVMMDRPRYNSDIEPEDIPLNIVYEDDCLLVVNKPAGLVVHPGCGNFHGTLVNAVAWHMRDNPDYDPNSPQVGLVHRIDKDTSGLMLACKNNETHLALADMLSRHEIVREYRALVYGVICEEKGNIDAPIGRSSSDRKKMAVVKDGKYAVTHFTVVKRYAEATDLLLRLETGRTHQIRVHMSYIGHPVMGDPVYAARRPKYGLEGQALHSCSVTFVHPRTHETMHFEAPLPEYYLEAVRSLNPI